MDWINVLVNAITQLAVITKERLLMLVVLSLFVYGFYVQHKTVVEERAERKAQEDKCSDLVAKIREDNRLSYNQQTLLFQNQINDFVIKKNKENDSIYNYFFTLIRKYNIKVSKINNELDKLKQNENVN